MMHPFFLHNLNILTKNFLFIFLLFFNLHVLAAEPRPVIIRQADHAEYYSIARNAVILEDAKHELTFEQVKTLSENSGNSFVVIGKDNPNYDFTTSTFWVKFQIKNEDTVLQKFLLEAARPLTDIAHLFIIHPDGTVSEQMNGDQRPFHEREIPHRKLIFPVHFQPGEVLTFYFQLRSDGDALILPIKLWKPEALMKCDYHELYMFGIYYGILFFVIIIYSFFYIALRVNSFLFYVAYVFTIAVLQLSLDGLSFQYLWPESIWWANHVLPMSATLTAIFVLLYAKSFLKLRENLSVFNKIFNVLLGLCLLCLAFSFTSGKLYALSFPLTNLLSLLSAFLVIITIFFIIKKRIKVSMYFTIAFISLVAGGILFILGNVNAIPVTFYTENALKFGSALEIMLLSLSMANKYREIQQEKELAQAQSLKIAQENEKLIREQNTMLEQKVNERTAEVVKQKEIIEEKNKDILDSIHYAKRIQRALLASDRILKKNLPEYFVLYKPKDIVSGDFYWAQETNGKFLIAACDCTGHGVPGAFMSLLNISFLNEVCIEKKISQPDMVLNNVRYSIINALNTEAEQESKDGMDSVLCSFDFVNKRMEAACANNPLWIIREKNLIELKPDKMPVGKHIHEDRTFSLQHFDLKENDTVYLFTDGYPDQFGGPKGKKFKYSQLATILLSIQGKNMPEQKDILHNTIEEWKGNLEQVDDICIIGIRLSSAMKA